jgi:hypothetical protein
MAQSKLMSAIGDQANFTSTENGAVTLKSTTSKVLDFFALGGALRSRNESSIIQIFTKAWYEDRDLALRVLFYLRDIRGGQGERRTFRTILKFMGNEAPDVVVKNFKYIAQMGRYDDFFELIGTSAAQEALTFLAEQIHQDIINRSEEKPISLLAKWAPSENTSSRDTRLQATIFRNFLGVTPRVYRKMLTDLRAYLNVIEVQMSAGKWDSIDFSKVPSNASKLYRKAFSKHTPEKYVAFLEAVEKGETKINAGTLYPHEIAGLFLNGRPQGTEARTLEAQWKALPNYIPENAGNALVLADVSGSMSGEPMSVSVSLAVYMAERNTGLFKDYFMVFESESHLMKIEGKTLADKLNSVKDSTGWCGSTNLQAAFDSILEAAVENKISPEEMPSKLYIISDMEFDTACGNSAYGRARKSQTNFSVAKAKYQAAGYEMPQIVFWNVSARHDQSPVSFDENGTMLVSGFSPSIFKNTLLAKVTTPYDLMLDVINAPRYAEIKA